MLVGSDYNENVSDYGVEEGTFWLDGSFYSEQSVISDKIPDFDIELVSIKMPAKQCLRLLF